MACFGKEVDIEMSVGFTYASTADLASKAYGN